MPTKGYTVHTVGGRVVVEEPREGFGMMLTVDDGLNPTTLRLTPAEWEELMSLRYKIDPIEPPLNPLEPPPPPHEPEIPL